MRQIKTIVPFFLLVIFLLSCGVTKKKKAEEGYFELLPQELMRVSMTVIDLISEDSNFYNFYLKPFNQSITHYHFKDHKHHALISPDSNFDYNTKECFLSKMWPYRYVDYRVNILRNAIPNAAYNWEKVNIDDNHRFYFRDNKYSIDSSRWYSIQDTTFIENVYDSKVVFHKEKVLIKIYPVLEDTSFMEDNLAEKKKEVTKNDSLPPRQNCTDIFPLKSIESYQDSLPKGNVVVVYSYIGCTPCQRLMNDLISKVEKNQINAERIKIINVIDPEIKIEKYRKNKGIPFQYLSCDIRCHSFSFPRVGGYFNGKLMWSADGYSPNVVKQISKYLKD